MKHKMIRLSRRYQAALRKHLKQDPRASLQPARGLGRQAVAIGLETSDVTRIHEEALATREASNHRNGLSKRAEGFFNEAIIPIAKTPRAPFNTNAHLSQVNKTLGRYTVDLAATNRSLKQGIARRKTVEQSLKKSAEHVQKLLKESRRLQKHLRHLTHQLLSAQEAERKKISHELQDEVAQNLLGINVRLLALKKAAKGGTASLTKEIASTQRLVEESVKSINRLARELDVH
jgi:signal transduction histidine kinase